MGTEVLARAYISAPVGDDVWVRPGPDQTLEDFQLIVAAAQAWEAIKHIEILEITEYPWTGGRLIDALRFRRLR
jgi:hypothetical protein